MANMQFRNVFAKAFTLTFALILIASLFLETTFDNIFVAITVVFVSSLIVAFTVSVVIYIVFRFRRSKTRMSDGSKELH